MLWLAAPEQVALDRAANFILLALAALSVYRLSALARNGILWRVSGKLILSYILVGAVPILLLVTFSLLAFLLIFFDVSAYLVQSRMTAMAEQASTMARTTLYELERSQEPREEILTRRENAIATRFPGVSIDVVRAREMPAWLKGPSFSGLVMTGARFTVRAVAVQGREPNAIAVVVDLPVDLSAADRSLGPAGIVLGEDRQRSRLNTATFITHTNWETGQPIRTAQPIGVHLPTLYRYISGTPDEERPSFNRLLLNVLIGIGVLLLVIEVVALGNGVALARSITAAVDDVFQGTERVTRGEFGHPIAVRSDDQLGRLAASFNHMTVRIRELLVEQDEKRRLAEELRIAREIQMSLLPQGRFEAPGMAILGMCVPAREVGGDYYDIFPLPDGRFGMLIADVSGKGTSAALYMAELKGLMLSLSRIHSSPRRLLIEADRIIAPHLDSRSFITVTYALVDPVARTMACARAGHCPFLRVAAGSRQAEMVAPDGMILGLNLDHGERFERSLEEITIPLNPGDVFLFYTDGVSDAMDPAGDYFGEERLMDSLAAFADEPADSLRDQLAMNITAFVRGQAQHDDITMIILKIDG